MDEGHWVLQIPCRFPPCVLGLHVRPGTSDGIVLDDIFFRGVFSRMPLPQDVTSVVSVLDAGANIGLASVYFSNM